MKKMIVVVDLGCLKAYRITKDELTGSERIELVEEFSPKEARTKPGDQVTDRSGRYATPAGGSSIGQNHHSEQELQRRLLGKLCGRLTQLLAREGCELWHLGAAKSINGRLLEQLPQQARQSLHKNIAADLIKADALDLLERFRAA